MLKIPIDQRTRVAHKRAGILKVLLACLTAIHLMACGGGGSSGTGASGAGTAEIASAVEISGSVGDGPVTGATISVYSAEGEMLGTMSSDATASFRSMIKVKGRDYPLLIKANGGFDLVTGAAPSFEMFSVMLRPSEKNNNVNPYTSLIVLVAQSLSGGLNAANVETARTIVMEKLGFGLDPNLIPDPVTSQIDVLRAANLIKSSEAVAELVRRTASTVSGAGGGQVTADGVVRALAADLTDGHLDGRGASGTDAQIAAVAQVVSAQVAVEVLRNELQVEGLIATGTLDEAIKTTQPGVSDSQLTAGVRITAGMLEQAKVALAAAQVLDSSSQVAGIAMEVGSIAPNSLPAAVKQVLSADAPAYLENAVVLSAGATTEQMASIGQVVLNDGGGTNPSGSGGGSGGTSGSTTSSSTTSSSTTSSSTTSSSTTSSSTTSGSTLSGSTTSGSTSDSGTSVPVSNTAPVIGGTPSGSVVAGNAYSFQPSASDADGDTLSFHITNQPGWASFSTVTGRLSGTPGAGSVGTYGNIVISVDDGTASASLPAFSIQVDAPPVQTGSVRLSWKAPVARADGAPLSLADIDGYHIHYGTSVGNYTNHLNVPDGTAQSAVLTDLPLGTYYLVMTTYDVNGRESGYSDAIATTVH